MCFSATASFTASFILLLIGIAAMRKVKNKLYYLGAMIPILFSIQQAMEGILWLTLTRFPQETVQTTVIYTYLIFAQIIWPIWTPLSVTIVEKNGRRRLLLIMLTIMGGALAFLLGYHLFKSSPHAQIAHHHIEYIYNTSASKATIDLISFLYLFIVTAGFFISTIRWMWLFGTGVILSFFIAYIYYYCCFGSLWCFFAAIVSVITYYIIAQEGQHSLEFKNRLD